MRKVSRSLFIVIVFLSAAVARAGVVVHVEKFGDNPASVGETFEARLSVDGDALVAGDQPVPNGLLAAAARVVFSKSFIVTDIVPKAQLDHLQPGQEALRVLELDVPSVGFRGNTQRDVPPVLPYTGALLAYIEMTPTVVGEFDLAAMPFDPAVSTNFIDGSGMAIDAQITFATSSVIVVPEPFMGMAFAASLILLGARHRRDRRIN